MTESKKNTIVQPSSIADVLNYIQTDASDTIAIFDIDDTLITPTNTHNSKAA